jgi:hypothetical protein
MMTPHDIETMGIMVSNARALGIDPIMHRASAFCRACEAVGVTFEAISVDDGWVTIPSWMLEAAIQYAHNDGYAGLTLGEFLLKLRSNDNDGCCAYAA